MRVNIDASDRTYLALCACGWRHLSLSRLGAWTVAREHELHAHPGDTDTRNGLASVQRRAGSE